MKERTILHCDLNNFFASVSLLSNKEYIDKPVAVCGSVEERHGIVLAKNDIAKRYGVKTAEAVWEAKLKCNELVILEPDYPEYMRYSKMAKEIYSRYTDLIEPFGVDECWLDVTGSRLLFGNGEQIAERIKNDIKRELGITASVGVSFNKIFAKLGSDMKKPDAVTLIPKESFKEIIYNLPAEDLLFVGKNTKDKLNRVGIFTIGDIAKSDEMLLKKMLGVSGCELKRNAMGLDNSPVLPENYHHIPKSVGRSVTPKSDIESREEVWKIYVRLAEDISKTLSEEDLFATGVCVHTRDSSLNIKETSKSFKGGTNCAMTLAKKAMEVFCESYSFEKPLRSVGFRAINLKERADVAVQEDIFGEYLCDKKEENLENSMRIVRNKYGKESIKRAVTVDT